MLKPDTFRRGLEEKIYDAIVRAGLKIVSRKKMWLDEKMIREYQPVLNEPSEFGEEWKREAIQAMIGAPVEILIVEGPDAIAKTKQIKTEIRGRYVLSQHYRDRVILNLIHTADNPLELYNNLKVLSPEILE